jgi:hypothetical protein
MMNCFVPMEPRQRHFTSKSPIIQVRYVQDFLSCVLHCFCHNRTENGSGHRQLAYTCQKCRNANLFRLCFPCKDPGRERSHCLGSYQVDGSGRLLSRPPRCIVGISAGVEVVVGEAVTFADESSGHCQVNMKRISNVRKNQSAN